MSPYSSFMTGTKLLIHSTSHLRRWLVKGLEKETKGKGGGGGNRLVEGVIPALGLSVIGYGIKMVKKSNDLLKKICMLKDVEPWVSGFLGMDLSSWIFE